MKLKMKKVCRNCENYLSAVVLPKGMEICKKYSPQVIFNPKPDDYDSKFPSVWDKFSCGEWV